MAHLLTGKMPLFTRSPIAARVHAPALPAWGVRSDPGPGRRCNEDRWHVDASAGLFALADGMGGAGAGEVASEIAVRVLVEHAAQALRTGLGASAALAQAAGLAHARIVAAARARPECLGMGSTLVAVAASADRLTVAHVGDSRAYLLRGATLTRLTDDHCLSQQLIRSGQISPAQGRRMDSQGPLTRALGVGAQPPVLQVSDVAWRSGDVLLLCSDGLSDVLDAETLCAQMLGLLKDARSDLDQTARALVQTALLAGSHDDMTALLIAAPGIGS